MKPVEIPGITLHHFIREWNECATGTFIQSLRSVGDEKFVLKTKSRTQTMEWLIHFPSILIESGHKWNTLEDQPGFVKRTKDTLDNAKIAQIIQHEMDRILVIECTGIKLILELFGDGNIILTNEKDKILDVLRAKEWKTRILKKGETYAFPPGPTAWNHLSTIIPSGGKSKSIGGMLVTQVGVPAPWTQSLCEVIQRKPDDEHPLNETEWKKIRETLKKWYQSSEKEIEWTQTKEKNWILPSNKGIETGNDLFTRGKMNEIQNQLEEMLTKEPIVYEEADERNDKERNALQINRDRQEKQKKEWEEEAKEKKRAGEWIYEHFDMVEKLVEAANQARKKKMSDEETLGKIQGKIKHVKKVDLKKGQLELELE
jgi:predicted ribosome quality control (RQC) complex YloA/Tae2 family protein